MNHSVFEYNYNHLINLSEIDATEFAKLKIHKRILYTLKLNNLESISSPECRMLIQFKGSIIELAGLKSISLESAEILSRFKGALTLGVEQIDPSIASILASHTEALSLPGLENCDDLSMQLLSNYQGNILQLDSIKKISVNQAKFLAKFKGEFLSLDGLIEISAPVAKSLSKYAGFLFLSALDKIPLNIAKELVKHKGSISLNGVRNITDEVAVIFSSKEGLYLDLKGIKKLSCNAQAILQNASAIVSVNPDLI
jgi:hypothetical protein